MVLIGFAHTFRDSGSTTYIIQEKELTPDRIRAAFALTLATAWLLAAVIGLGSGYAAEFYREPGIRTVMLILSLNFILLPFGSVPMAYMHRQMDSQRIALINIIPNVISVITSIGMAYKGFGYLSMAWGSVSGTVCTIILVQLWRPTGLPFLPGFKEIKRVLSFGVLANLMMILIDVSRGGPDLIIGRLSGVTTLSFFGRSMGLISMFEKLVMRALWSVALAHFSLQSRNKGGMKDSFLESATLVTAVAWPFFINLGLLGRSVILVFYGNQWVDSILPMQLLCLAAILTSPFLLAGPMMTAIGQMKQNLYQLFIRVPVLLVLVFFAAPYGLKVIASVFILSSLIDMVVGYLQCKIVLMINLKDMVRALYKSAGVALISAIFSLVLFLFGRDIPLWLQLSLGAMGSALGWGVALYLLKHPLRREIDQSFMMAKRTLATLTR